MSYLYASDFLVTKKVKIKNLFPYMDHKPAKGTAKFGASLETKTGRYLPIT